MTQAPSTTQSATKNRKPEKTFRCGQVRASVWKNEVQRDNRTVISFSIRIEKRYRDRQSGEWRDSDYFFTDDLPRLALVAQKAFEFATMHESESDDTEAVN